MERERQWSMLRYIWMDGRLGWAGRGAGIELVEAVACVICCCFLNVHRKQVMNKEGVGISEY